MNLLSRSLLLGFLLAMGSALAQSWHGQLDDGREISVDPATNRPLFDDGRPLWDGVHRLRDGTTITVNSGVMVPTEALLEHRLGQAQTGEQAPGSEAILPCREVVELACGVGNVCEDQEACRLAQQLSDMALRAHARPALDLDWVLGQCRQALRDREGFPACDQPPRGPGAACLRLATLVCGSANECAQSDNCQMAQELSALERRERLSGLRPDDRSPSQKCEILLKESSAFSACQP